MGKKVNPKVLRLNITRTWTSKWFGTGKDYNKKLEQDVRIKRYLLKQLREAGVDRVVIERSANKININIYTAKPGAIIGRGGTGIDDLKKTIHRKFLSRPMGIKPEDVNLNVFEVERPNLSAQINFNYLNLLINN